MPKGQPKAGLRHRTRHAAYGAVPLIDRLDALWDVQPLPSVVLVVDLKIAAQTVSLSSFHFWLLLIKSYYPPQTIFYPKQLTS